MNGMMEYQGYHAKIEYSDEDKLFIGEVFGIRDSLNFHGESIQELEEMFHQSIDNYLENCRAFGKEPDKEFRGSFNVRLTPEQHRAAALAAKSHGITLNQFIALAVEECLNPKGVKETLMILPVINQKIGNSEFSTHSYKNYKLSNQETVKKEVIFPNEYQC